jgi:hypothetical protein
MGLDNLTKYWKTIFFSKRENDIIYHYYKLQKYLNHLEDEINKKFIPYKIFTLTFTTDIQSQIIILEKQIADYSKLPWYSRLAAIFTGKSKKINEIRLWLSYHSYKELQLGQAYLEPMLNLSVPNIKKYLDVKPYVDSKLKSILHSLKSDINSYFDIKRPLKYSLAFTIKLLMSGDKFMFGRLLSKKASSNIDLMSQNQSKPNLTLEEARSLSYAYYNLCGFFYLNAISATQTNCRSHFEALIKHLSKNDFPDKNQLVDLIHSQYKLLSDCYFKLTHVTPKLWKMWIAEDTQYYQQAFQDGMNLRNRYLAKTQVSSPGHMFNISDPLQNLYQRKSDWVIKAPIEKTLQATPDGKNLAITKKFIFACGFYKLPLANTSLNDLKRVHRKLQLRLHPDKLPSQYVDLFGSLESYSPHILKRCRDRIAVIFNIFMSLINLDIFINKAIDLRLISENEKKNIFLSGKKSRNNLEQAILEAVNKNENLFSNDRAEGVRLKRLAFKAEMETKLIKDCYELRQELLQKLENDRQESLQKLENDRQESLQKLENVHQETLESLSKFNADLQKFKNDRQKNDLQDFRRGIQTIRDMFLDAHANKIIKLDADQLEYLTKPFDLNSSDQSDNESTQPHVLPAVLSSENSTPVETFEEQACGKDSADVIPTPSSFRL